VSIKLILPHSLGLILNKNIKKILSLWDGENKDYTSGEVVAYPGILSLIVRGN